MSKIGEALRHFRTSRSEKLTQAELGKVLKKETVDAGRNAIRRYENGTTPPSKKDVDAILNYLGVSHEEFNEYIDSDHRRLVLGGIAVDDKFFDIWPDAIKYFEAFSKVAEIGSPKSQIAVIEEMIEALTERVNEYAALNTENKDRANLKLVGDDDSIKSNNTEESE